MALESTFEDGRKVQAMYAMVRRGPMVQRFLVYREGTSGKWLSSEGISVSGVQRTPESLVRSIGRADPVDEKYVLPAV